MNKFSTFFKEFPNKILGTLKPSTDKYGKPITIVFGDIENLNNIDVSPSLEPQIRELVEVVDFDVKNISHALSEYDKTEKTKEKPKKVTASKSKLYIPEIPSENYKLFQGEEAFKYLNSDIETEDVEVWVYYCESQNRPVHPYLTQKYKVAYTNDWFAERMKSGHLCYDFISKTYVPRVVYYAGNIYEKIKFTESYAVNRTYPTELESQLNFQLEKLKEIKPKPLLLTGELDERLMLDPISNFCEKFELEYEGDLTTLTNAFKKFLRNVDSSEQLTDVQLYKVINVIIEGQRFTESTSVKKPDDYWGKTWQERDFIDEKLKNEAKAIKKVEKDIFLRKGLQEIRYFMPKFLESLDKVERERIENNWNYENNAFVDANYNQVPIMFEFNSIFKDAPLVIRPEQREGVAFQEINGTGVCGYDVGVGKTLTAILTIAQFMQSGRCKRPILVVPKPTYYKWIGEMHGIIDENNFLTHQGILPNYKINSFYNFGEGLMRGNEEIEVEDYSITIVTYQGAKALGFSDDFNNEFKDKISLILDQYDPNETERQRAAQQKKFESETSVGQVGAKIMMDYHFWDYLIMDEAHNANKIFMNVKGAVNEDGKRENSRYSFANGSGQPSLLGKKMFFLSQYVQFMSKGLGNVNLLTATPFTNNPLNVFNIFALANFDRLKAYGIENVNKFFQEYVDVTYEDVVTSKGSIESKQVIKGWKNKIALQKILFGIINYKSAADSPFVKRPIKFTLPLLSEMVEGQMLPLPKEKQISTILKPTQWQKRNQKEISDWLQLQLQDKELKKLAPHLVADIKSCKNTISPHVYSEIDPATIDPKEFIEESPKLKAMTSAMKLTNDWFDKKGESRSGQIIYINGAIEYMPLIKKYLIDYLGYKTNVLEVGKNKYLDEVEILAGDSITDELKEDVKNGFNDGVIKVVIGSSTIREGIDLQMRTSDLHNLWIDWNPTDYKQLEGRLWRFGNKFDYVRIISYLVSGGSDAFKFQKLEEKTARINDIFDRANKSNILEVTEEDREAVKWALIDDVSIIAKEKIKQEVELIDKQISVNKNNIEKYQDLDSIIKKLTKLEDYFKDKIQIYIDNAIMLDLPDLQLDLPLIDKIRIIKRNNKKIEDSDLSYSAKNLITDWNFNYEYGQYNDNLKKIKSLNEKTLKEKNVTIFEIDTTILIEEINTENNILVDKIDTLNSQENIDRLTAELQAQKDKLEGDSLTPEKVAERIALLNDTVLKVLSAETVVKVLENPKVSKQKIEIVNQTAIPIEEILNDPLLDTLGNIPKITKYKLWTITKKPNNIFEVRDPKGQLQMETNNKGTLKEAKEWVDKFNDIFLENYPEFKALKESVSRTKSKQTKKSTKPIQLISYDEKPLSDQLKAVTGEPFTDNYKLEGDIYTHLPTGQRFIVPIEKQMISEINYLQPMEDFQSRLSLEPNLIANKMNFYYKHENGTVWELPIDFDSTFNPKFEENFKINAWISQLYRFQLRKIVEKINEGVKVPTEVLEDFWMDYFHGTPNKILVDALENQQKQKGLKVEQEHKKTLEKVAKGKIDVNEAIEKTVEDHLKENPNYYNELEQIPMIKSVRKYKSSTRSDAYDFVRNVQTYSYEVIFENGKSIFLNAKDKDEAKHLAIDEYKSKKQPKQISETENLQQAIEALELTFEFTDKSKDKEQLQEAIDALKITLEFL